MNYPLNRREALGLLGAGAATAMLPVTGASAKEPDFPKGAIIRTILKDVPPSALAKGSTLFHEHVSMTTPYPYQKPPARPVPPNFTGNVDMMVEEVRAAGKDGLSCLVDGGHPDMGRSLDALKRIATESGVYIVASGGYYTQFAYPPEIATMSEDQVTEELVKQAKDGHLGAFGEIGSSATMTDDERKVFRAVGKAHLRTGIPIFTHNAYSGPRARNGPPQNALDQLDIFESLGVKPEHVVIGHLCCLEDYELQKAIAKRGAYVGIDRIGGEIMLPDAVRVKMVTSLVEAGYANRVMLSSDFFQEPMLKSKGGAGIAYVVTQFLPKLRAAGIKDEVVHSISVDNPRRWLAFVPKKD
jgi:predicted metal-dependent phosphotriesterase family hydrolase